MKDEYRFRSVKVDCPPAERLSEEAAAQREEEQRAVEAAQVGPLLGRVLRARRAAPLPRALERPHRGLQQAAQLRLPARRVPAHQVSRALSIITLWSRAVMLMPVYLILVEGVVGWDIQEERLNFASHQSLTLLARKYLISSCLYFPPIACVGS